MTTKLLFLTFGLAVGVCSCSKKNDPVPPPTTPPGSTVVCTSNPVGPAKNDSFLLQNGEAILQMTDTNFTGSICGLLPLSKNNWWAYNDSTFDNAGNFISRTYDTLKVAAIKKSLADKSIWWVMTNTQNNVTKNGIPGTHVYSTDAVLYTLGYGFADPMEFNPFYTSPWLETATDTITKGYWESDVPYLATTYPLGQPVVVKAGSFSNCYKTVKDLYSYTQEIIYKPGVGIISNKIYPKPNGSSNGVLPFSSELVNYKLY
jgi:hypothetical protein